MAGLAGVRISGLLELQNPTGKELLWVSGICVRRRVSSGLLTGAQGFGSLQGPRDP